MSRLGAPPAGGARPEVSRAAVALPAEHGGWGLIGEPLILGLVLAPSWAAGSVALASLAAFLLHHPLKLLLGDMRRRTWYPRTGAALSFALSYAVAVAAGTLVAALTASGAFWWPLLASAPLALLQLAYDSRNQSRALVAEVAGAAALAAVAPAVLLASGWAPVAAATIWWLCAARGISSVTYVRARLRRDRGMPAGTATPLAVHAAVLVSAIGLWRTGNVGLMTLVACAVLLVRAAWGLSSWHSVVKPRVVGFQELALGVTTTVLVCLGQWPQRP